MTMTWQKALNGIANAERDYRLARGIFNGFDGADSYNETVTIAAARLADDMAEVFGAFGDIAAAKDYAGARVLASFGAMAAELRRLQDENAELKKSEALKDGAERRRVELVAELQSLRDKAESIRYDIGELPARFIGGDVPAAASLIRQLPELQQAIRDAESVLGDN